MECKKDSQAMYDLYEEYKKTLKISKVPLRKRQDINRNIRETYSEPHRRQDHIANVNDITQWNSMVGELEENLREIEGYLDFEDRYYLHKEYNDIKSMIRNPNSYEGEVFMECLYQDAVTDDVADIICNVELQEEIIALMCEVLTKRQKQVVNLYFWEDKTQEQIAGILGINQSNVTRSLQNAIKILQNHMKREIFDCFYA